jgi:hypothetical protein
MHGKKIILPLVFVAALAQGMILGGCGGNSSPTGAADSAEVQLKLLGAGASAARSALGTVRSADVAGATVLVDGVSAGVTDTSGEITLKLEPGTYTITISSGGVTSSALKITVGQGELIKIEVEMKPDGTLIVEQDTDHDGDIDDADDDLDDLDDDHDVADVDDDDDDDHHEVKPEKKPKPSLN